MSELDLFRLVILPVGLGQLGFVEPCSIGSNLVFIKYIEGQSAAIRVAQVGVFALLPPLGMLLMLMDDGLAEEGRLLAFAVLFVSIGALINGMTISYLGFLMEISPDDRRPAYGMMGGIMGGMMRGMRHAGIWSINGVAATGHVMEPFLTLQRGRAYVLAMHNDTAWHHPMHLHGHSFRVIARDGQPTRHQEWQDTVLMAPRERVEIAFVADNPGDWMFHCHILEHQAAGMMGVIRVA